MGTEMDFLPVSPVVFHILLAIGEDERHGYGIMQEVAEVTEGRIRLGPGTLYGAIKKLLEDGLIVEVERKVASEVDDSRRRYYRLTKLGARVATAEAQRLESAVKLARRKGVLAGA